MRTVNGQRDGVFCHDILNSVELKVKRKSDCPIVDSRNLAVENAPETSNNTDDEGGFVLVGIESKSTGLGPESFSRRWQLAGVCVDFCMVAGHYAIGSLYVSIFRRFLTQSVGFTSMFLDVLEPYTRTSI
jgi:hypothetical protein